MNHGSLFSGIGGFDLAAEWMGWNNIFHCEINKFCQKVLKYHWPNTTLHEDIKTTDFTNYRGRIDIISGGFPCQPFSTAGKRKGKEDDRHLWPEMLRAIREIQPTWIVPENVYGIVNWKRGLVFEEINAQMEDEGYQIAPVILPACSIGAIHKRYRTWFIAYSDKNYGIRKSRKYSEEAERKKIQKRDEVEYPSEPIDLWNDPDTNGQRRKRVNKQDRNEKGQVQKPDKTFSSHFIAKGQDDLPKPCVISKNDGLPFELDGITISKWIDESISGFGNAIVPQLAYEIFKAIESYEFINNQP